MKAGKTRVTTGIAIFAAAAFFIVGLTVPIIVTHEQNVTVCTAGAGCGPCSSSFSLFSWLMGMPLNTNCDHPEVTFSSLTTYTISNGLADATLEYPNIPVNLTLGTFSFHMIYNGTGYGAANGTEYLGFDVVFSVTNQTQSQVVVFQWGPYGPTTNLPSPTTASLYGGVVTMNWTATSSAYPYVTGPAAFLNILVKTSSG